MQAPSMLGTFLVSVTLAACGSSGSSGSPGGAGGSAGGGGAGGAAQCNAVDLQSDSANCGVCGHDCLGAPCTQGRCEPTVLASGLLEGTSTLAVSFTWLTLDQDALYWPSEAEGGSVRAIGKGGGSVYTVIALPAKPTSVLVDDTAIYYVSKSIGRIEKQGGANQLIAAGLHDPAGWAAQDADAIYVADYGYAQVSRYPKDGSSSSVVGGSNSKTAFVAVRGDHLVYFSLVSYQGTLRYRSLSGAVPDGDIGNQVGLPRGLVCDDSAAYFVAEAPGDVTTGVLAQVALPGGGQSTLATLPAAPGGLAMDDDELFVSVADGTVLAIPKQGTDTPRTLASAQGLPHAITADDARVYWLRQSAKGAPSELVWVAK